MMNKALLILYYSIFSKLPSSWWPGGKLFNKLRILILRRIIKIGKDVKFQKGIYIGSGRNIRIGDRCQINEGIRLDNVHLGNNVMIGRESIFIGKMHISEDINIPMNEQGKKIDFVTVVEDDVWIGLRVIIMPGVKIRKGSIIGAGSIVTKNTEEYGVYVGVPAKKIKNRNTNDNISQK